MLSFVRIIINAQAEKKKIKLYQAKHLHTINYVLHGLSNLKEQHKKCTSL